MVGRPALRHLILAAAVAAWASPAMAQPPASPPPPRPATRPGASAPDSEADRLAEAAGKAIEAGHLDEAESLQRRSLAIREKIVGPEHPDVARSLATLAMIRSERGTSEEALTLLKRALEIRNRALGPDHPETAKVYQKMGVVELLRGRLAPALDDMNRALKIQTKALGADHPDVAETLSDSAAALLVAARRYRERPTPKVLLARLKGERTNSVRPMALAEAEKSLKRAVAIFEKSGKAKTPRMALALDNLAAVCVEQGRYLEAESLTSRALAIADAALRPDDPNLAIFIEQRINALKLHRLDPAERAEVRTLTARAKAIRERETDSAAKTRTKEDSTRRS
ncbi:MAG TPA: tetratricopeptide repeat-containing protein [Isosphaeraceae bacterium]|jgi:tetratricopeptide (TPR) repeat protein|nr:tetratricopeptide repeat-containing protein [Isosphaeraceae bacterium]